MFCSSPNACLGAQLKKKSSSELLILSLLTSKIMKNSSPGSPWTTIFCPSSNCTGSKASATVRRSHLSRDSAELRVHYWSLLKAQITPLAMYLYRGQCISGCICASVIKRELRVILDWCSCDELPQQPVIIIMLGISFITVWQLVPLQNKNLLTYPI